MNPPLGLGCDDQQLWAPWHCSLHTTCHGPAPADLCITSLTHAPVSCTGWYFVVYFMDASLGITLAITFHRLVNATARWLYHRHISQKDFENDHPWFEALVRAWHRAWGYQGACRLCELWYRSAQLRTCEPHSDISQMLNPNKCCPGGHWPLWGCSNTQLPEMGGAGCGLGAVRDHCTHHRGLRRGECSTLAVHNHSRSGC